MELPDWAIAALGAFPVICSAVGALIWFVRLEANVKSNKADIATLKAEFSSLDTKLDRIDRNLHRIMGKLGIEPVE